MTVDLNGKHHHGAGLHIRQMSLPQGEASITHAHKEDHLSILASGECSVIGEGVSNTYTGPTCIKIKQGIHYVIAALTDVEWFCISDEHGKDSDLVSIGD